MTSTAPIIVCVLPLAISLAAQEPNPAAAVYTDAEVASVIDGRFEIAAHGSRDMPIWGARLRDELPEGGLSEEIVRGQITMLVDYLKSIQRPAP